MKESNVIESHLCSYQRTNKGLEQALKLIIRGGMKLEYTIQKLARLGKISTRTLRYYDEIQLLKPKRINSSGYRIYGTAEVDRLQQILLYRKLGLAIADIKKIVADPDFDEEQALQDHYQALLNKRQELDSLIQTVDLTIRSRQGGTKMNDEQKFVGFKQESLQENETKFGAEIRKKYGDQEVEAAYEKFSNLTKEQYDKMLALNEQVFQLLAKAMETKDPRGDLARDLAKAHQQWLTYTWPNYSKEAHASLAEIYVADERFTAYYDHQVGTGAARFLFEAIQAYTKTDL